MRISQLYKSLIVHVYMYTAGVQTPLHGTMLVSDTEGTVPQVAHGQGSVLPSSHVILLRHLLSSAMKGLRFLLMKLI